MWRDLPRLVDVECKKTGLLFNSKAFFRQEVALDVNIPETGFFENRDHDVVWRELSGLLILSVKNCLVTQKHFSC